ncbi:hypothetical protein HMPREF1548_01078 [Clostridium sp. KLE 1755]|nr:hypothetical protein HMPREF1548_01078 [Clostridium sp. KLE 1755]
MLWLNFLVSIISYNKIGVVLVYGVVLYTHIKLNESKYINEIF